MKTPVTNEEYRVPTDKEKEALITLLTDEDPAIIAAVRSRILSYGQSACRWLRPYATTADLVLRRRTQEIVHLLCRQENDERFLAFCQHSGEELDLERGCGLLSQTWFPQANWEAYEALFDQWAAELRPRIDFASAPERILRTIHHFFFNALGFAGTENYGGLPECSYLTSVVDNRRGNPISLCSVYLFLARRLCLPLTGIGLPGHFICRYQTSTKEIYLDIFRRGRFLNRADCVRFLAQSCHGLNEGFLSPVSNRRMLSRMCANLHQTYSQLELAQEAARVQRYLIALAR